MIDGDDKYNLAHVDRVIVAHGGLREGMDGKLYVIAPVFFEKPKARTGGRSDGI